jgi:RNA recognition motif-containing protein
VGHLHISFKSLHGVPNPQRVTEENIREMYKNVGNINDVTVKRHAISSEVRIHMCNVCLVLCVLISKFIVCQGIVSGFGFVAFAKPDDIIAIVQNKNGILVRERDGIRYQGRLSPKKNL